MPTTPEEFFVKGLMEQSPPSPPVFLDLPQKPYGSSDCQHHVPNNDMMLPYISRLLMEDHVDDKVIDHPALLQVQQPFAQILSASTSFGTNTSNKEVFNNLLQEGGDEENMLNSTLSKGTDAVWQFLRGMEEARMLLPQDEQVNHSGVKERYNRDQNLEEVRTSKEAMRIKECEEKSGNEVVDEFMLHGYEACIREMENLHVAMDNKAEKKNRKSGSKVARDNVPDIRTLLIRCAQEVAANNHMRASELLNQINQHASETGDATQRLAQCFSKGLEARLTGTGSQVWRLLMAEHPRVTEFMMACNLYSAASCVNSVTYYFSALTIMQAMVGKRRLHIVDYGMPYGFQWVCLLRLLACREDGLPEVKITAIGRPKHKPWPTADIEEIGCQLSKCAKEFGLSLFKFHIVMAEWENVSIKDLNIDADEVLVVNDLFSFSTLMDESVFFDNPNPRDTVLNNITKMRPDVFIQSIFNCSYGYSFFPRFREALFYFMAIFDILDATVPRQNKHRQLLEQVVFGRSVLNTIACEGLDLVERPEKYRQWQARNQRAGLRQLPLKLGIVEEVENQIMKHHHKDFFITQDGQWLVQGWMGRVLFAHSTWVAEDASSDIE